MALINDWVVIGGFSVCNAVKDQRNFFKKKLLILETPQRLPLAINEQLSSLMGVFA